MEDEKISAFSELADEILNGGAYKATKYFGENLTIKATRKRYKRKSRNDAQYPIEILFTIGEPNYEERRNIKKGKVNNWGPAEIKLNFSKKDKQ